MNVLQRIERKTVVDDNGCWLWGGGLLKTGYGQINTGRGTGRVHKVLYELLRGPVGRLILHHSCGVKRCINPDHLRPVTRAEHARLHAAERTRSAS